MEQVQIASNLQDKLFSAIVKVLKTEQAMPEEGITAAVSAVTNLICACSQAMYGFKDKKQQKNFAKDIFQQTINQL